MRKPAKSKVPKMSKSKKILLQALSVQSILLLVILLVLLTLVGCATTERVEYVYLSPECTVPPIVEPIGFSWDDLKSVPLEVKIQINETVQTLVDEILLRQAMLVEICEGSND